jgi:hypothetical protein
MKKGLKKYLALALKNQVVIGIAAVIASFIGVIKYKLDIPTTFLVAIACFFIAIPFNLIVSFINYRFLADEKSKKQLAETSKFFREITEEAKINDNKKYLSNQIFFGVIIILLVCLPLGWFIYKTSTPEAISREQNPTLGLFIDRILMIAYIFFALISIYFLYYLSLIRLSGRKLVKVN